MASSITLFGRRDVNPIKVVLVRDERDGKDPEQLIFVRDEQVVKPVNLLEENVLREVTMPNPLNDGHEKNAKIISIRKITNYHF